jgi:hypothetical protein
MPKKSKLVVLQAGNTHAKTQRRQDEVVVDAGVEVHRELGLVFKPNQAVQRMRLRRVADLFVLLIAGIVGFVGLVVVLMLASKPGNPVTVTLQSYTNGCAVITITNQTSGPFIFHTMVDRKIGGQWRWPMGQTPPVAA